jgi:hypothetical protein
MSQQTEKVVKVLMFLTCLGMAMVFLGGYCNYKVTIENGNKTPVKTNYTIANLSTHFNFIDDSEVKYPLLADRIDLGDIIVSVGDILMLNGIQITISSVIILIAIVFILEIEKYKLNKIKKKIKWHSKKN